MPAGATRRSNDTTPSNRSSPSTTGRASAPAALSRSSASGTVSLTRVRRRRPEQVTDRQNRGVQSERDHPRDDVAGRQDAGQSTRGAAALHDHDPVDLLTGSTNGRNAIEPRKDRVEAAAASSAAFPCPRMSKRHSALMAEEPALHLFLAAGAAGIENPIAPGGLRT